MHFEGIFLKYSNEEGIFLVFSGFFHPACLNSKALLPSLIFQKSLKGECVLVVKYLLCSNEAMSSIPQSTPDYRCQPGSTSICDTQCYQQALCLWCVIFGKHHSLMCVKPYILQQQTTKLKEAK